MNEHVSFPKKALASAVTLVSLFGQSIPTGLAQRPTTSPAYETLFSIPKGGDTGATYLYEDTPEMLPSGPHRLMIGADGSFLVLDQNADRILRYERDGTFANAITIPSSTLFDAIMYEDGLYAIGSVEDQWKLHRLSLEGKLLDSQVVTLPKSKGMQVFNTLKVKNGDMTLEYTDSDLKTTVDVVLIDEPDEKTPTIELRATDARSTDIILNGRSIDTITSNTTIHSANIFSIQPDGAFQIKATDVISNPAIVVDEIVRSYDADGNLLGMARSPLAEQYIQPQESIAVSTVGELFAMVTRKDGISIVRLPLQISIGTNLSEPAREQPAVKTKLRAFLDVFSSFFVKHVPTAEAVSCSQWRSRSAIANQANEYLNNWTSMTMTNMDRNKNRCGDRAVPDQFMNKTSTTNMPSVAYKWGGYDLPSAYNSAMSSNQIGGNAKAASTSCSNSGLIRGVDCSGFVSRVWNIGQQTTISLPNYSAQINTFNLSKGDILNYAGKHVRLVEHIDGNGAYVWESTVDTPAHGYGSFDGVLFRYYSWNNFFNYTPRRYNCVQ